MKRTLVFLGFLTAMLGIFSSLWAATINVGPNETFTTIQAAINAAVEDDVILVLSGTFENQHLLINKRITLKTVGAKDEPAVLDGGDTGTVVTITAAGAVLEGFTIQNSGTGQMDAGVIVNVPYPDQCKVLGNTIKNNANGIIAIGGFANWLNSNIVHNNSYYGIVSIASHSTVIKFNNIYSNDLDAIALENINLLPESGGAVLPGATYSFIYDNDISSNRDGIFLGRNCNNTTIENNRITATRMGINAWLANSVHVQWNTITNSAMGVRFFESNIDNSIWGNTISGNVVGIQMDRGNQDGTFINSAATIKYNKLIGNTNYALFNNNPLTQGTTVVAEYNWWDTPAGPIVSTGSDIDGPNGVNTYPANNIYVDFRPFWTNVEMTTLSSDVDIFVEAPKELIHGSEEQTYLVKAQKTEDLLGYAVQVKIPKADFDAPHEFTMGSAFSMNIPPDPALWEDFSTTADWIYTVSAARFDQTGYTDPANVLLFSFKMSSKNVNNFSPGSFIDLPQTEIVLYGPGNPPANINCHSVTGKLIKIDFEAPSMAVIPEVPGLLPIIIRPTEYGSESAIGVTTLTLSFADNYNLDYINYLIQPQTDPATVPVVGAFSIDVATAIDGILWPNPAATWEIPNVHLNTLADGTYEIYFLAVDDAGNPYVNSTPWVFIIDKTAPNPITWAKCLTAENGNESIDLEWTSANAVKYHVWVLDYDDIITPSWGTGTTEPYPQYNPAGFSFSVPNVPDPRGATPQNGWTMLANDVTTTSYVHTGMDRGYFYYYVFAEDAAGNISMQSELRESISYWPGDVEIDSAVNAADISALSAVWGTDGSLNPVCDVGPTIGRTRRGLPTPDDRINIEDLMIFAMNYGNTDYDTYDRTVPEINPIQIEMYCQSIGDQLIVQLNLAENNGFVKGLNIPILYGSGLTLQSVENGNIWPADSMLLHNNANNCLELSASVLGDGMIEANGRIATLTFNIGGTDSSLELQHMIARTIENVDIEIIDNPEESPTGNNDPENIIPVTSYLGANYPNPFNPTTTIQFGLNQMENVRITIFNSRGQLVKNLVNGIMPAGTHNVVWNGMDNNNRSLGSGVYFYRMETKNLSETKKAILIK